MQSLVIIAHDIRSCHNIGSLLRTAEGLGINHVYITGYSPYPLAPNDTRLPHIAAKLNRQISKTALGAEKTQKWSYHDSVTNLIDTLRYDGYTIAALEQSSKSVSLPDFQPPQKLAIILGREVEGLESALLDHCSVHLEIPMFGSKESFNVVQAAAMAMYHCRFTGIAKS